MNTQKSTQDLELVLKSARPEDIGTFLQEQKDALAEGQKPFAA